MKQLEKPLLKKKWEMIFFSSFVKPNNTLEEKAGCYLKVMWFYVMIKYEKFNYGHETNFLFLKQLIFFFKV